MVLSILSWGAAAQATAIHLTATLTPPLAGDKGAALVLPVSFTIGDAGPLLPVAFACTHATCEGSVELSPGSWVVRSTGEGDYWIKPLALSVLESAKEASAELEIFRLAEAQFDVVSKKSTKAVSAPTLRFRFPGNSSLRFFDAPPCEMKDRSCTCKLPSVPVDLRLEATGFVPVHFWSRRPPFDLGGERHLVEMEPGASLSGWIEGVRDGKEPVEIQLFELSQPTLVAPKDSSVSGLATAIGSDLSFFSLGPVRPGKYEIDVSQVGTLGARYRILTLKTEEAAFIANPIRLERGQGALQVSVTPPRTEDGQEWRLRLLFFNGPPQIAELAGEWLFEGSTTLSNLVAGSYRLTLVDGSGTAWADEAFEIGQEPVVREYQLASPLQVSGNVTLGEEPLAEADLFFGQGMLRSKFLSDNDGAFEGSLPKDGKWKVTVRAREPQLHRQVEIEVARSPTLGPVLINIRLPGGGFEGIVKHEDGRVAERATVSLARLDSDEQSLGWVLSDERGRFAHEGLSPGKYSVAAQGVWEVAEASNDATVEVTEHSKSPDVTLELHPKRVLRGTVSDPNGSLPGATLYFLSSSNPLASIQEEATSGSDGTFEVALANNYYPLLVTVVAAGHPAVSLAVAKGNDPLEVFVPFDAAKVLVFDPRPPREDGQRRQLVLLKDGLPLLEGWTPAFRGYLQNAPSPPVEVNVLQGSFIACAGSMAEIQALLVSGHRDRSLFCADGNVAAGSSLFLRLEPISVSN